MMKKKKKKKKKNKTKKTKKKKKKRRRRRKITSERRIPTVPSMDLQIHSNTRIFSPKPGHINWSKLRLVMN